jgi:hypothetical protein
MNALQLEVGKTYLDREGREVKIFRRNLGSCRGSFPYEGDNGETYTANGQLYRTIQTIKDLISEVPEEETASYKIRILDRDNESPWQRFIRDTLEKAAGDAIAPIYTKGIITDEEATKLFGDVYVLIMDFLEGRRG